MIKTCLGPTEFLQRDKKNNRSYILKINSWATFAKWKIQHSKGKHFLTIQARHKNSCLLI